MHHLRFDRQLRGINVFRVTPARLRGDLKVHYVEAVIKRGEAREKWVTFEVCDYGREGRTTSSGPWALSQHSEDCYTLEACHLHHELPKDSYLLAGVPADVMANVHGA